jgi:hypothetical protein
VSFINNNASALYEEALHARLDYIFSTRPEADVVQLEAIALQASLRLADAEGQPSIAILNQEIDLYIHVEENRDEIEKYLKGGKQ